MRTRCLRLGNDQFTIIAHELLNVLRANVSIDWAHRDSARIRLRVLVKRILQKYGCLSILKMQQSEESCLKQNRFMKIPLR